MHLDGSVMTAAAVYLLSLVGIAASIAAGGAADLWLNATEQETVTDVLRAAPSLFLVPAGVLVLLLAVMAVHLYLEWPT